MELIVNGTAVDQPLSERLVERSILAMTGEGDSFVILAKDEMTYMQTSGGPVSGFILEYQDGSLDRHYSCTNKDLSASQVVQVFQQYLSGDGRWKTDLTWESQSLDSSPSSSVARTLLTSIAVLIVAYVLWQLANAT